MFHFQRVNLDSRDATKDKWIPEQLARAAFREGILALDRTNDCYCLPQGTTVFPYHALLQLAKRKNLPYEVR